MTLPVVLAIAGSIALFVGLFGGGVKAKEIVVPTLPRGPRILTSSFGGILIGIAIWLSLPANTVSPIPTETISPTSTQQVVLALTTPTAATVAVASSPLPTSTLSMTATLEPISDSPMPICVLENFESAEQMKWWTPDSRVFEYHETSERAHSGTQSLRVKYSKTDTYQFIGAELPAGSCDFTKGRALQMWVYGKVTFLLKLEDQNLKQVDVNEQRVTDATGWTLLTFKYTAAESAIDLSRIRSILLFPAPGDTSASGNVFLDDIAVFP